MGFRQIHSEDLVLAAQRPRLGTAIGRGLGHIRAVAAVACGNGRLLDFAGLRIRLLDRTDDTRQTQQLQRLLQGHGLRLHRLEQRRHLRFRGAALLAAFGSCRLALRILRLRDGQRDIRAESAVAHFDNAACRRIGAQFTRTAGVAFDQLMAFLDGQLVGGERRRQGCPLGIAFGIQMIHILEIRAVTSDAHMQAVTDFNGVDRTGINLAQLRDLLLQAFMRFIGVRRRTVAGPEIEAGQPLLAGLLATGDAVEAIFHIRRELVIHILGEIRFQQLDHSERKP